VATARVREATEKQEREEEESWRRFKNFISHVNWTDTTGEYTSQGGWPVSRATVGGVTLSHANQTGATGSYVVPRPPRVRATNFQKSFD
jgi:hypothetical protein